MKKILIQYKRMLTGRLLSIFRNLRFLLLCIVPRITKKKLFLNKKDIGVLLIGSPPDTGLGLTLRSIYDVLVSKVTCDIVYLRSPKFKLSTSRNSIKKKINIFVGTPNFLAGTIFRKNMFFSIYRNFNVGLWFWEIENPPKEWALISQWTDEIWVQTDFVYKIFKKVSSNVYKIPFSIDIKWNKNKTRSYFNLPEKKFIFLFTFDFWSCYVRKNPEAVIEAFKKAFANRNDVFLLIKTIHGEDLQDDMNRLISVIGGAPNIELRNIFISDEDQYSLLNTCSAYVSLHRSEGLGLGLAEAMFLGKPVIATNYSGNLEFMNKKNSCLVNYSLTPVERNNSYPYPYTAKQFWAEPDIKHAAYLMRKVKDNHKFRNKIKRQAYHDMEYYTFENLQKAILKRVNKITK